MGKTESTDIGYKRLENKKITDIFINRSAHSYFARGLLVTRATNNIIKRLS